MSTKNVREYYGRKPQGALQDWLQSVDALKAAATSTGHGTDIALHPRLLHFVRSRFFSVCSFLCAKRIVDYRIACLWLCKRSKNWHSRTLSLLSCMPL